MGRSKHARVVAYVAVAVALLAVLADSGASKPLVVIGTVAEFQPGMWLSVSNEQILTLRVALRETTTYEVQDSHASLDSAGIATGVLVRVWYRFVGERHPVADKVRVVQGAVDRG
jgi:hypothetical protein